MTIAKLARSEIQALKPYEAAAQADDKIRVNANEAPWTGSTDHFRRPLNRYPELRPSRLIGSCFLSCRTGQPAHHDTNILDVQALRGGSRCRDT